MKGSPTLRHWFRPVRRAIRYGPGDVVDRLRGHELLTPPRRLSFVGDEEDFHALGRLNAQLCRDVGGLEPTERVLDIGCGIGRLAIHLTDHLTPPGSYLGFDTSNAMIRWARRKITPRHPNFTFETAPIFNTLYNPRGTILAKDYRFPADDESIDLAVAFSVYTHLTPEDARHYLAETARVLAPGGRMLVTFFVWTDESAAAWENGRAGIDFRYDEGEFRTTDRARPEDAVAYTPEWLRTEIERAGLSLAAPIEAGSWAGGDGRSFQDIVLASKA